MSPASSTLTEIFPEDISSVSDSENDDGDTTTSLANKMCGIVPRRSAVQKFKFHNFQTEKKEENESPSSSPIILPSPDPVLIISSDEELEQSMIAIEEKVSLEMDSD